MATLNLEKDQKISINNYNFIVKDVIKQSFMLGNDTQKNYYAYELESSDPKITSAIIEYFSDDNIVLKITRKVEAKISEHNVVLEGKSFKILKEIDEIFLDKNGAIKDCVIYELEDDHQLIPQSELHVVNEKLNLFYQPVRIKKEDIIYG